MRAKRETTIVAERKAAHLCRYPACNRLGDHARGMCESHYRGAANYVARQIISWERLEQRGKVARKEMSFKEWLLS